MIEPTEYVNCCSWRAPMVTLIDGTETPSDSEAWRFECEARHILNLPNKEMRQSMLAKIGERRGVDAKVKLETKIIEVWQHRQAQAEKLAAATQAGA